MASRLISTEDARNYLSHIIYNLIFDIFLNFLLDSDIFKMLEGGGGGIIVSERHVGFNVNLKHLGLTKVYHGVVYVLSNSMKSGF